MYYVLRNQFILQYECRQRLNKHIRKDYYGGTVKPNTKLNWHKWNKSTSDHLTTGKLILFDVYISNTIHLMFGKNSVNWAGRIQSSRQFKFSYCDNKNSVNLTTRIQLTRQHEFSWLAMKNPISLTAKIHLTRHLKFSKLDNENSVNRQEKPSL